MWWLLWKPSDPTERLEWGGGEKRLLTGQESAFRKLAGQLAQGAQHRNNQDTPQKQWSERTTSPTPKSCSLGHAGIMACAALIHK